MNVGLDVDDTLFDFCGRAHAAIVKAGLDNGATITQWECHRDYNITREQFWDVVTAAYLDGMLMEPPYEGVQAQILELMEMGHQVHLITARGFEGELAGMIREETRRWAARWNVPHDSLTFAKDKAALGMDYFLDDGVHNVSALRQAGCEAYLRDQVHNRASDLPRVADLAEFVALIGAESRVMA